MTTTRLREASVLSRMKAVTGGKKAAARVKAWKARVLLAKMDFGFMGLTKGMVTGLTVMTILTEWQRERMTRL